VNVAFHDTGVSAKFTSVRYALLTRQAHHPLINLFGDLRSQQREGSAEGSEIGRDFGIEAGETADTPSCCGVPVPDRGSSSPSGAS